MPLIRPGEPQLPGLVEALERGWSPNTLGGVLLGPFTKPAAFGLTPGLRYRITLT